MSALERLLQQLADEGISRGAGSFSLDPRARLEKLARYQSAEPALYLLKAVQAAVWLGAEAVEIRLARGYVEVFFDHTSRVSLEELLSRGHLSTMLLAALALESSQLELSWHSKTQSQTWTPGQGLQQATSQKPGCRLRLSRDKISFWERYLPVAQMASVQTTLQRRCQFCPIPVRLDGRVINAGLPDFGRPGTVERIELKEDGPHFRLADYRRRPPGCVLSSLGRHPLDGQFEGARAARLSVLEGVLPSCRLIERDREVNKNGDTDPRALWLGVQGRDYQVLYGYLARPPAEQSDSLPVRSWISLAASPDRRFRLFYVQHGVLLNLVESEGVWPGALCLLARNEVETDLGQLEVVRGERVQSDLLWLGEQVGQLLDSLRLEENQQTDPYAVLLKPVTEFQPFAAAVWEQEYGLAQSLLSDRVTLGPAHSLFGLAEKFDQPVQLQFDRAQGLLVLHYGSQSKIPQETLAPLGELSRVELNWVDYIHEREWPAPDEPAYQARLRLIFGDRHLCFCAGGYVKMGTVGDYANFRQWARELAEQFGAACDTRQGRQRMW